MLARSMSDERQDHAARVRVPHGGGVVDRFEHATELLPPPTAFRIRT